MTSFLPRGFLRVRCQIQIQPVRFRLINVQKPWPPHFERAKVEHACKPIIPREWVRDPDVPAYQKCKASIRHFKKEEIENPYETLLAKRALNWFNNSKMIAYVHRNNLNGFEDFDMRLMAKKNNMRYQMMGRKLMEKTVKGTQYESALCLFKSTTGVVWSEEPQVALLLKILKKNPKLHLMAGMVEGRFLSRSQMEYYASLPDLQTARASLVGVLNSAASNVVSNINQHQITLVQHLQQHIQQSQDNSAEGEKPAPPETSEKPTPAETPDS